MSREIRFLVIFYIYILLSFFFRIDFHLHLHLNFNSSVFSIIYLVSLSTIRLMMSFIYDIYERAESEFEKSTRAYQSILIFISRFSCSWEIDSCEKWVWSRNRFWLMMTRHNSEVSRYSDSLWSQIVKISNTTFSSIQSSSYDTSWSMTITRWFYLDRRWEWFCDFEKSYWDLSYCVTFDLHIFHLVMRFWSWTLQISSSDEILTDEMTTRDRLAIDSTRSLVINSR